MAKLIFILWFSLGTVGLFMETSSIVSSTSTKIDNESIKLSTAKNRSSIHSDLVDSGVETDHKRELASLMEQIDVWGLNIFEVHKFSRQHSLTTVMYTIFKKRNFMQKFNISREKLISYLLKIEKRYQNVPYHNMIHAAEVTQSVHVLLQLPPLNSVFNDLEIMAALFAAAIHDVDHPGVSNQYLIDSANELALLYNDKSILENHSLAVAFKILKEEKDCNFLENLDKIQWKILRKLCIDMVLATDMSEHNSLLVKLRALVETKDVAASDNKILLLQEYAERVLVLQNILHCADLSNPTKPLKIYRKWVGMLMNEFHQQGDQERTWRLAISPLCDRYNEANLERSQVQFIDYIVQPLWKTFANLVSQSSVVQSILRNMAENREWFADRLLLDSTFSSIGSGSR